jgi:hypothetical protein
MEKRKSKYLIIAMPAEQETSTESWTEALTRTTGITHTFKKAYEVGLFLAGITKPETAYRKALETVKVYNVVSFKQKDGEQCVTIVNTKVY